MVYDWMECVARSHFLNAFTRVNGLKHGKIVFVEVTHAGHTARHPARSLYLAFAKARKLVGSVCHAIRTSL